MYEASCLALMLKDKFEFCYKAPIEEKDEWYIVPQLLSSSQPIKPHYPWDSHTTILG